MNKNILLLSWHPEANTVMNAGGFRRAYEIAKRAPQNVNLVCLDTEPSYFQDLNIEVETYRIPQFIRWITLKNFYLGKSLEKLFVSAYIFFKILAKYRDYTIYVPYSELTQLSFPAILSKLFTKQRVVLVNLNVNHYFPETLINPVLHRICRI